jgi:adenosylcobinamide-GDP ribazoletransferase
MPSVDASPRSLARAAASFPVVGAVLGLAVGGLGLLAEPALPPGPAVVLQMLAVVLLTGGLHLDGLMDTADGVLGGRTPPRRLEIMRDSRVGAFGVAAAGLALLAQYACLVELAPLPRLIALALALALGRWAMVLAMGAFPSARSDGLGASFAEGDELWPPIVATVLAVGAAVAAALVWASASPIAWPAGQLSGELPPPPVDPAIVGWLLGLGAMALALAVALVGGRWLAGRLGGLTGDTYGALCVVAETAVLYLAVALR